MWLGIFTTLAIVLLLRIGRGEFARGVAWSGTWACLLLSRALLAVGSGFAIAGKAVADFGIRLCRYVRRSYEAQL